MDGALISFIFILKTVSTKLYESSVPFSSKHKIMAKLLLGVTTDDSPNKVIRSKI